MLQDDLVANERVVTIKRQPGGGLGISVKGGAEHGIPVLISRVFTGQSGISIYDILALVEIASGQNLRRSKSAQNKKMY